MANTFGVTTADPFGIASADFVLVGLTQDTGYTAAVADDARGEYVAASQKSVNGVTRVTATYKSVISTGNVTLTPTAGSATYAIDSVTINLAKGAHSTGTVTGHIHGEGGHNDSERQITIPAFPGFGASAFGLTTGVTDANIQSATYTVTIGHTDDQKADGDHLIGTSHGEKHTVTIESVEDSITPAAPSGWVLTGGGGVEGNQAHKRGTVSAEKYVGYSYS
jgi:hypothetical protein